MPFFTQKVCGRARTRLPTEVDRKSPFPIAVLQLCLATQVICARADILDVREQITRETQLYRSAHPEFQAAPKHDFRPTRVQAATSPDMQLPGGVGFGYYFDDAAFRWTNSTIMDYYIIAPSTMGGNLNYYLYLTSTCRAQLGTEALVSYYSQNQAGFWVFDWSLPSNQWQVGITLPGSHIQYLTTRADEFANPRQMCHVRNGTFLTGFAAGLYTWENKVWLFNFPRGDWDLLYSHSYTTTNLSSNLFISNAQHGYWGPIVEVFLSNGTYQNLNLAGFDLTRMFQDANPNSQWLSAANSFVLQMSPFKVLTQTQDRGFVAFTGNGPRNTFRIASVASASPGQGVIDIASANGHAYQLYSSPTPAGPWAALGPQLFGNGTSLQFEVTTTLSAAFFRVSDVYDTGSLDIVANTNAAGFTLDPPRGITNANWVPLPDGNHWEKTVVGLSPGTYTVNFGVIPGLPSLPSQTVTVTRGNISPVSANYTLPP
jgi:hypothetical protein